MSEFWIWFWRPVAELLGTIALAVALLALATAIVIAGTSIDKVKSWRKRRVQKDKLSNPE